LPLRTGIEERDQFGAVDSGLVHAPYRHVWFGVNIGAVGLEAEALRHLAMLTVFAHDHICRGRNRSCAPVQGVSLVGVDYGRDARGGAVLLIAAMSFVTLGDFRDGKLRRPSYDVGIRRGIELAEIRRYRARRDRDDDADINSTPRRKERKRPTG